MTVGSISDIMAEMNRFAMANSAARFQPGAIGIDGRHQEMRGIGDYASLDDGYPSRDRGRDRDREQRDARSRDDRDRGRDRSRRREDRDRRGDWSHDRERSRHRERSSNRDRSPVHSEYSDGRGSMYEVYDDDYSEESERDRYRSRDERDSRHSDDKAGDKWVCTQPSRTIILRGLHVDITEKIIGAELMMLGLPVKDIRLIRRSSGVSRGFAFVEFHNVADAQRWMEHTQVDRLIDQEKI